ncbi:hypothetical protein [Streptomyces violaceusniger]
MPDRVREARELARVLRAGGKCWSARRSASGCTR